MSSLVINGDTSGSITLAAPAVAGSTTLTLPTTTSTLAFNGPTFSYYSSSGVTCNTGSATKITFTSSEWDTTSGMYSSSRFTPTVAGYYQINAATCIVAAGNSYSMVYKNGSEFKRGFQPQTSVTAVTYTVNALVYCNGSTDYVEIYFGNNGGTNQTTITGNSLTYFQAFLARSA